MEKEIFAKLFETDNHQVLVKKEYDDKEDHFEIRLTTSHDGADFSMSLGYEKEKKRDDEFDKYSQADAEKFLKTLDGFINK